MIEDRDAYTAIIDWCNDLAAFTPLVMVVNAPDLEAVYERIPYVLLAAYGHEPSTRDCGVPEDWTITIAVFAGDLSGRQVCDHATVLHAANYDDDVRDLMILDQASQRAGAA
ncbi:hypothetical protein ACGFJT_37495 [Actinomadura geliboluensis]|uniref:hypothetical protein n=1 Tax=Actinomadura geliboluensis TaxID=882440 RepID=UPI003711B848